LHGSAPVFVFHRKGFGSIRLIINKSGKMVEKGINFSANILIAFTSPPDYFHALVLLLPTAKKSY